MASYKKIASRQDKRVAEASGLRIRPNSGAISGHKGDLGGSDIFVETKTRAEVKDHLGLDVKWLVKAKEQAFSMGKALYVLVLAAGDSQDYAVLPWRVLRSQVQDLEDWDADYTCEGRGSYLKIPLDKIDTILYRKRRVEVVPAAKVSAYQLPEAIGVLYLQDLLAVLNRLPTWDPEAFSSDPYVPHLDKKQYYPHIRKPEGIPIGAELQELEKWKQN